MSLGVVSITQSLDFRQSVTALLSFVLAMTLFPEVQERAQAEIDETIGGDRLPRISDWMQLRYCVALCKEIQRFVCIFIYPIMRGI